MRYANAECFASAATIVELIVPEGVLVKAIGLLMAKGASFADIFVERAAADTIESDDRRINTSTVVEKGVGLRAVKDGRASYAYTSRYLPEDIYITAKYVASALAEMLSADQVKKGRSLVPMAHLQLLR